MDIAAAAVKVNGPVHGPPFAPVNPAMHKQASRDVAPVPVVLLLAGQAVHAVVLTK